MWYFRQAVCNREFQQDVIRACQPLSISREKLQFRDQSRQVVASKRFRSNIVMELRFRFKFQQCMWEGPGLLLVGEYISKKESPFDSLPYSSIVWFPTTSSTCIYHSNNYLFQKIFGTFNFGRIFLWGETCFHCCRSSFSEVRTWAQAGSLNSKKAEPGCQNSGSNINSKIEQILGPVLLSKNMIDWLISEWGGDFLSEAEPTRDQEIPARDRRTM